MFFFSDLHRVLLFIIVTTPFINAANVCPVNNQHMPIRNNCRAYYNCSSGFPVLAVCPEGKYFNCMRQVCESQTLELCCNEDITVNKSVAFNNFNETSYNCKENVMFDLNGSPEIVKCVNNTLIVSVCSYPTIFCSISLHCYDNSTGQCNEHANSGSFKPVNTTKGTSISLSPCENCPSDNSNFNIVNNCSAYYNCSTGKPYLTTCPTGYVYDCMNDVCSTKTYVLCCVSDYTPNMDDHMIYNMEYSCTDNLKLDFYTSRGGMYLYCSKDTVYLGMCDPAYYCNLTKTCYNNVTETCKSTASNSECTTTIGTFTTRASTSTGTLSSSTKVISISTTSKTTSTGTTGTAILGTIVMS